MENNTKNKSGKIILIVTIITAVLALAAAATVIILFMNNDEHKLKKQLELGQKYLEQGDYEEAIAEFEKALEIDPMNVKAYMGMAEAYKEMEEYEEAYEVLCEIKEALEDEGMDNTREYKKIEKECQKLEELIGGEKVIDGSEGTGGAGSDEVGPGEDEGLGESGDSATDDGGNNGGEDGEIEAGNNNDSISQLEVRISWDASTIDDLSMVSEGLCGDSISDLTCDMFGEVLVYVDSRGNDVAHEYYPAAGEVFDNVTLCMFDLTRVYHYEWNPGPSANCQFYSGLVLELYKDGKLIDKIDNNYAYRYLAPTGAWVFSVGITEDGFIDQDPLDPGYSKDYSTWPDDYY